MTNKHIELPAPSFRLTWKGDKAAYYVDKPNIDSTDCYTPDDVRAAIAAHEQARVVGEPVSDVTSIGAMCLILEANLIKADEYTDCAIVYKVTFDQLRNLYDQGRATNKHAVHDSDCSTNNRGCPELLGPCDCSASPPAPQEAQADAWRDAVWLAHEHLRLNDYYCPGHNIYDTLAALLAAPVAQPATEQAEAREEQWRVVTWSSKTDRTFTKRDEALEYLRANDTDGDWHIKHVPGKKTTIYDGWFGEQAEAPSDKMSYAMLEEQNEQIRELNTSLDVECARLEKEVSVLTEMLHREVCATQPTATEQAEAKRVAELERHNKALIERRQHDVADIKRYCAMVVDLEKQLAATQPTASNAGERWPQPEFRKCEHCGCETNAKMRACCRAGWVDDKVTSENRAALALAAIPADSERASVILDLRVIARTTLHASIEGSERARERDVVLKAVELLAAAPAPPTAPAQDAQGERNAKMLIDIGNAALRAGWDGVDLQAFVIGRLASPSPSAVQPLSEAQVDAAAQKLAECMDYPWEHMPEQGRKSMREHAKAVIEAGIVTKEST